MNRGRWEGACMDGGPWCKFIQIKDADCLLLSIIIIIIIVSMALCRCSYFLFLGHLKVKNDVAGVYYDRLGYDTSNLSLRYKGNGE